MPGFLFVSATADCYLRLPLLNWRLVLVERISLLRNVGKFDSVNSGRQLPFSKATLIFAENGRGKTTLAAILRSLSDGDPVHINERKRLTAAHDPHVVVNVAGTAPHVFQNGTWSATIPDLAVFDDAFVAQNVCSGVDIEPGHRQNLHELILGAQGVALNAAAQAHVSKIEEHNRDIRTKEAAIPATARAGLTVDAFCALKKNPNIVGAISEAERSLNAAQAADAVRREDGFNKIELPRFDTIALNSLFKLSLPEIDTTAFAQVQKHFSEIGDGERWVEDGMHRIIRSDTADEACPFCAQNLSGSPLIGHYRSYFSEAYAQLKREIDLTLQEVRKFHAGDAPAAFERSVHLWEQRRNFWKDFVIVPKVTVDTAAVALSWKIARDAIVADLQKKQAAPLEPLEMTSATLGAIADFDRARDMVASASSTLTSVNDQIASVKERAATANIATLTGELEKLKATEARHSAKIAPLCDAYQDEKKAKKITEGLRDQARDALEQYRASVFPAYENAINSYLRAFGAGFRLDSVTSVNSRGGSSCTYNVVIDNTSVPLTGAPGTPAFKNTLSAGDRNTLALAFFFASLDGDPRLSNKIVVIDDPMTSLDESRSTTTVQELGRLVDRVSQVIVLSHSRPFLCAVWKKFEKFTRTAIKVVRDRDGSDLIGWNVQQDSITDHDKRHAKVVAYIASNNVADQREVAQSLRPMLESFMRVAYPEDFPPDSLLGQFQTICSQRVGQPNQILNAVDTAVLRDLVDYGNRFHHDNPTWQTEIINDQELQHFCERIVAFTRRA
ncbi:MAG: AAA family ATPase [Rhizobiales bacterium]|nr:AAA family ATPase [Hyphomicrobiales bacterium]